MEREVEGALRGRDGQKPHGMGPGALRGRELHTRIYIYLVYRAILYDMLHGMI